MFIVVIRRLIFTGILSYNIWHILTKMILCKLFYLIFNSILLEMLEITKGQKNQLTYSSASK